MRVNVDYFQAIWPAIGGKIPSARFHSPLGARWHECTPFVAASNNQFRCPPPPCDEQFRIHDRVQ